MPSGQNEACSRIFINKALEFSGWNFLDLKQVQFELHTTQGGADCTRKNKPGHVSDVLKAKRAVRPVGDRLTYV